jgi:hypothetical protein
MTAVNLGPSGGPGGNGGVTVTDDADFLNGRDANGQLIVPADSKVAHVQLSFDNNHQAVSAIRFSHNSSKGLQDLPQHGVFGGTIFTIDPLLGHITRISGTYDRFVSSITIETDNPDVPPLTVPPTGATGPAQYDYTAPDGFEIVGFFGRQGTLIDAMGVVLRAKSA